MAIRAIVSDQSADFAAQVIGTGPEFTVIAFLELPPGSWVAFATAAFAANGPPGTSVVQTVFLLDDEIYSTAVQSDFVISDTFEGARVVPLTTGLTLHKPQTLQVGCLATQPVILSQQTTITAIEVDSVTRIQNQAPGIELGPEARSTCGRTQAGSTSVATRILRRRKPDERGLATAASVVEAHLRDKTPGREVWPVVQLGNGWHLRARW